MKNTHAIIKLGTNTLTCKTGACAHKLMRLAQQVRHLQQHGHRIVLVLSGAVQSGHSLLPASHKLNGTTKPIAAGLGQAMLTSQLITAFSAQDIKIAQVLLTQIDLTDTIRSQHIRKVINAATKHHIVPILNENDILELNSFGGNDFLAAQVACLLKAKHLLLLTDVDGVLDPQRQVIRKLTSHSQIANITQSSCHISVGGIQAKIAAARHAASAGVKSIIASGNHFDILTQIIHHKQPIGTRVLP